MGAYQGQRATGKAKPSQQEAPRPPPPRRCRTAALHEPAFPAGQSGDDDGVRRRRARGPASSTRSAKRPPRRRCRGWATACTRAIPRRGAPTRPGDEPPPNDPETEGDGAGHIARPHSAAVPAASRAVVRQTHRPATAMRKRPNRGPASRCAAPSRCAPSVQLDVGDADDLAPRLDIGGEPGLHRLRRAGRTMPPCSAIFSWMSGIARIYSEARH